MEFMIIIIACAAAGIICLGMYSAMKPVSKQQTAGQYVTQDRLVMNVNEDHFIRETETRTRIVNQAVPGISSGSAGASPGQNMTISASAPGTGSGQGSPFTIHGQGFGQGHVQGHSGSFIDLTGGAGRPGASSGQSHSMGQQIHFGQHGQGQQNPAGSAHKPGYIDLSQGSRQNKGPKKGQ